MPKPVLTEVLADLLPFQQAVSNELGELAGQIYAGGAAVGELTAPRAAETLLAWQKRGISQNFLLHHALPTCFC